MERISFRIVFSGKLSRIILRSYIQMDRDIAIMCCMICRSLIGKFVYTAGIPAWFRMPGRADRGHDNIKEDMRFDQ